MKNVKIGIVVASLGLLFAGALFGCKKSEEPAATPDSSSAPKKTSQAAEPAVPAEPAKQATLVDFKNEKGELVCPVTGEEIADKTKAAGHKDYNGKTYYFCCKMCPPLFDKEPAKFAEGKAIKEGKTIKM